MATPTLSLAHRMGEGGRRPGEGTCLGRGEGERETFFNATGLAQIRLVAMASDVSRRNQMKAEGAWMTGVCVSLAPLSDGARNSTPSRQDAKAQENR